MRSLASFAWAAFLLGMGACVSLDKPTAIAVCEKNNQCSGGAGGEASDAKGNSDLDQGSVQDAVFDAGTIARPIAHLTARWLTSPLWMPPRIPHKMWLWIWQQTCHAVPAGAQGAQWRPAPCVASP